MDKEGVYYSFLQSGITVELCNQCKGKQIFFLQNIYSYLELDNVVSATNFYSCFNFYKYMSKAYPSCVQCRESNEIPHILNSSQLFPQYLGVDRIKIHAK